MANVASVVEDPSEIRDFTVADGVGIEQFTLCKLSDPRTAAASSANSDVFAGIAMTEKKASNGKTNLGLAQNGIFVLTAGVTSGITAGNLVSLCGANLIKIATEAEVVTGDVIGKALEDIASGTTGEVRVGAI